MTWLDVQSSNVGAIAYDADIATMAVRYKDGSVYVRPNVTATQFGALATAQSKGKFLSGMLPGKMIRIERSHAEDSQSTERDGPLATEPAVPLNVIDEEASPCCRLAFHDRWPTFGSASCPECGTTFEPHMVGPLRHWRIKPAFAIARPKAMGRAEHAVRCHEPR